MPKEENIKRININGISLEYPLFRSADFTLEQRSTLNILKHFFLGELKSSMHALDK